MMKLKNKIAGSLVNIPGWRTNRCIIVIESDDWGSIRMPSNQIYKKLLSIGLPVDKSHYNKYDSLESNSDLELLFEVLTSYKDKYGNNPVITANNIVANPYFEKIKESDFQRYYYEPFTETLKQYPEHDKVIELYKEGISNKIFYPQFHGREHVNIFTWLEALREKDKSTKEIFEYGMFTVNLNNSSSCKDVYLDSFGTHNDNELVKIKDSLIEGLELFEDLWDFKSKSFIASCYIWHPAVEEYLNEYGIKHIQSSRIQKIPVLKPAYPTGMYDRQAGSNNYRIKRLWTGRKNKLGQIYTCRNVIFEPSANPDKDWVDSALKEIELAFWWRKPAIISSHRVNYIGFIHEENRTRNLKLLKVLLRKILNKWPNVEFMNSVQLGKIIRTIQL